MAPRSVIGMVTFCFEGAAPDLAMFAVFAQARGNDIDTARQYAAREGGPLFRTGSIGSGREGIFTLPSQGSLLRAETDGSLGRTISGVSDYSSDPVGLPHYSLTPFWRHQVLFGLVFRSFLC